MEYDEPGRGTSDDHNQPAGVSTAVPASGDPVSGEPGRDRIAVHVAWEAVLVVAVALLGFLLWMESPESLRGPGLRVLLVAVVGLGLLTLAAGLSLRASAPNLAIGPVAVAAALHFAEQGDRGVTEAVAPAVVVAVIGGVFLASFVVGLHVPAWAASLAGAAGVVVYIERRQVPVLVQAEYDPRRSAYYLFAGFAAVAVLGGLFGAIRTVRTLVGRFRPVVDPARRRGAVAALVTAGALTGSTVLATVAGVLFAANASGPVTPHPGLDWTALGVGMALLGGTSAFGRRGGVGGTLLAVLLVGFFLAYVRAAGHEISRWAVAGAVLGLGLVVTRVVETYGQPRPTMGDRLELRSAGEATTSSGWALPRAAADRSWPPAMPARATLDAVDPWERWDSRPDRWRGEGR